MVRSCDADDLGEPDRDGVPASAADPIDVRALIERNRGGEAVGLPCFCTANEQVLRSVLGFAAEHELPAVIEATCNQVNQDGGYTGMTPDAFVEWLRALARECALPAERLLLGGDHLGPNPWRREAAASAMDKARALVARYAAAGFRKIHLDASMPCGGEPPPNGATVAARAAELCAVAEAHAPDPASLFYVVGTEVPTPGGETEALDALEVTTVESLADTLDAHRLAFAERGLDAAWARVVSVVTQPGVEFGHTSVHAFESAAAAPLRAAIDAVPGLSFEAHSTDYQTDEALAALVGNRCFFLKVGPELTFRFREAVYALAEIESWVADEPSDVREVLAARMAANPEHWQDHYRGGSAQVEMLQRFSYSDRIRYYWREPVVADALQRLFDNLRRGPIPATLVSQHFPDIPFGRMPSDPDALVRHRVQGSVRRYFEACGFRRRP